MKTWIWIVILGLVALFSYSSGAATGYFAGSGLSGSESSGEAYDVAPDETIALRIETYRFRPDPLALTARKLTELAITNEDDATHTFTYDGGDHLLPPDATVRILVQFDTPGSIAYHCKPHDNMRGEIHVREA